MMALLSRTSTLNYEPLARLSRALGNARVYVRDLLFPNNVIKLRELPRSWTDRDTLLFHAAFQVLVDFVEQERPFADRDSRGVPSVVQMRGWLERNYNSRWARQQFYADWFTADERASADEQLANTYQIYREILELYEWYKNKGYELDTANLYENTGEKHVFTPSGMQMVDTGKPKLITWMDVVKATEAHDVLCDEQLARVLRVRRHLWT